MGILADDLTGALDAAAAFAAPARPVAAVWAGSSSDDLADFALDSETRDAPAALARAMVARLLPRLLGKRIRYKKIDSLLRGNTVAEIAACGRSTVFGAVVVAPAFPAQARITRQGRQYACAGGEWQPVGPSLGDGLRAEAVTSRLFGRGERTSGAGVLVCDAESDADLVAIAGSEAELAAPVLWCGSAGLARALAGPRAPIALPRARSVLALIGSRHDASREQVRRLAAARPAILVRLATPGGAEDAAAATAARLNAHGRAALAMDLPALAPADGEALLADVTARIVDAVAPPDLIVVAGGDTLMKVAMAVGATRLDTVGEWRPGMPLSRFADGRWRGTAILSKSGAFGGAATLADAFDGVAGRAG